MGFSFGRAVTALATGGLSEAARKLKGQQQNLPQEALETPEQAEARRKLLGFASSGTYGKFTAGAEVPLEYGDFNATDIEGQGLSNLQGLLRSGIPDQYRLGDEALRDILATSPEAIDAQFQPFKTRATREIRESEDAFKRGAGFAGNLYSTNTMEELGGIRARGNETLIGELARLTDSALNRRLSAIPLAYQSGREQEDLAMGRVAASQTFGGLTRQLNDAKIKARDAELLRRRQELGLPLQALTNVAGQNSTFGVPSIPYQEQSPYMDLLNIAASLGGRFAGAR